MAGIYIHIPFCKQKCIYCDFMSGTNIGQKERYVDAVIREMSLRRDYLKGERIRTIYFGGGTPSVLSKRELEVLFSALNEYWDLSEMEECTVECNPEDMTMQYVEMLAELPFNRISIGVQSFDEEELRWLNRRHDAATAERAVRNAQQCGFSNISIDLMYSLPIQSLTTWRETLDRALTLGVSHISAYSLMYEDGSKLSKLLASNRVSPLDEDTAVKMFDMLCSVLDEAGYEQYEISNFSLPGYNSRHNSSYWDYTPYLGLGAAAYSFDGIQRHYNLPHTIKYCTAIEQGSAFCNEEKLTEKERYNEYVFTALRTRKGVNLEGLRERFGITYYEYACRMAQKNISAGLLIKEGDVIRLTHRGIYVSDTVMSDFMTVD